MRSRQTGAPLLRHHHLRLVARAASAATVAIGATCLLPSISGAAQAPVGLGTAHSFAVLAGEGITNANATTITGDVGTFPNPDETGFDTVTLTGTNHHGDAVTQKAKDDLVTAYDQAAGATPTSVAVELGGTTLKPGVYRGATLEITGTLTLDTEGDPNAVFIFQTGSTLLTAVDSAVVVLNGGQACNVFWQVPSSATLGTNSHLIGTVLASTAISANSGATIEGRLLAQTASVTLDHNRITVPNCSPSTTPADEGATGPTGTSPDGSPSGGSGDTTTTPLPTGESTDTSTASGAPATPISGISTRSGTPTATATPIGSTPGSPSRPRGPVTPPAVRRPPLPNTGIESHLPIVGGLTVALGVVLVRFSRRLPRAH